jgi:hypothetical protein
MKKIYSILFIGVLIISGYGVFAYPDEIIRQDNITIKFTEFNLIEEENFISVELKGTNSFFIKKDYYIMPTNQKTITFPVGTKILNVECKTGQIFNEYSAKEPMISPDPILISSVKDFDVNTQTNKQGISFDDWFDYRIGTGIRGSERYLILKIQTFPVHYNSNEQILSWTDSIDIIIDYQLPEKNIQFNDEYMFLILSPSEFEDNLQELVNHKISRNIPTNLVTLEEIYAGSIFPVEGRDDQEKIKYFIKNAIDNWGITSVLLIGGIDKFPARETHIKVSNSDSEIFVSDLYYADIYNETYEFSSWDSNENDNFAEYNWGSNRLTDDVDLMPDIQIGRLACIDSSQVITSVNKIINYENNKAYTQDWFTNLIVVGGDSFPGDDDEILEGEVVNNRVIQIMDGFISTSLNATNGVLSKISPTGVASISNAINDGAGFVDFSGHGNTQVWATHPHENENVWLPTPTGNYKSGDISVLNNDEKLPIVVTGACSVGKYNRDENCFSWMFVANPNGGGIASFGATALGYAYIGSWVTYGLVERIAINMFSAYRNGATTVGEMWLNGIDDYITSGMDAGDYKTLEEWQLFGDPTLAVSEASQKPEKPNPPEGPASARVREDQTYTAITTDPDGDKIYYLFDWGDGELSGWIGPYNSGQSAESSHIWDTRGDYEIRVKAKDDHGVQSEWSDPLPISMAKNNLILNHRLSNLFEKFPEILTIIKTLLN